MATKFEDFMKEIEEEAKAAGKEAELEALRTYYRNKVKKELKNSNE